jgi:pseudaminic acid biosynthesis-associated methylase
MDYKNHQIKRWGGKFGEAYTERNASTVEEMEEKYKQNFGLPRSELNESFLGDLDRDLRILEVGTNVGIQLELVERLGFQDLFGMDVQRYAVREAHRQRPALNIIEGNVLDIPFKSDYFDLVFTSGLLIHIHPDDIGQALNEIVRCTRQYVWGFEYYSDEYEEVRYRGNDNLLWKTDFARLYVQNFDVELRQSEFVQYQDGDNQDQMYLLELDDA